MLIIAVVNRHKATQHELILVWFCLFPGSIIMLHSNCNLLQTETDPHHLLHLQRSCMAPAG